MKNSIRSLVLAAAVFALPSTATAQDQTLAIGYTDIGAVIGLGNTGDVGLAFGGRFERVFRELPDLGTGTLGIGIAVDMWSWSYSYFGGSWSVRNIPIGVTADYHFNLENKKLVPYLGAGLGYNIYSCSYSGVFSGGISNNCGYSSGIYFIGKAGARYFFQDNLALYGDVGAGAAALNLGLVFKLR